ncbi:MAG: leucyl aminopeptidase [Dermatophilaceae bacterium]|nr:leucyl aminopeptidase [Intrasporangiaceae bacterium]
MPTVALTPRDPATLAVDVLVIGAVSVDGAAALLRGHGLPRNAAAHLKSALETVGATAQAEEVTGFVAVPGVKAKRVLVVGLGIGTPTTAPTVPEVLRRAAGAAARAVKKNASVVLALPAPTAEAVAAIADGAYAGGYDIRKLTTKDAPEPRIGEIQVATTLEDSALAARVEILGAARAWCQDLVNTPPNLMYPQSFADAVSEKVRETKAKVTVEVLDEKALAKGGFGGILAVGQASARQPRLVTMSYAPRGAQASIGLVGKGITFDSGGLCIKPAAGMLTMKMDMAGAAAVAATVVAAAQLKLPVAVTGYLCLAENMPSGNAYRPSDVVTMYGGKTVEVLNTDAEGRMVMADGIALASESHPDAIIDIATLTGAQMIALGNRVAAVMANDDSLREMVAALGTDTGESIWPMPLPQDLRTALDTPNADIAHKGDQWGGMLTAGIFLSEFVGSPKGAEETPGEPTPRIPWAHIDIAGPAWNDKAAWGHTPRGATGFGVAALLSVLESYA